MSETVKQKIIKHFNDLIDWQRRDVKIKQRWLRENTDASPQAIKSMKKGMSEITHWISEYQSFIQWVREH